MLPESSTNLIITICRERSLSIVSKSIVKTSKRTAKIAFSRFCHGEFVYDTIVASISHII